MLSENEFEAAYDGMVYIRSVPMAELPPEVQKHSDGHTEMFAIHDATGQVLGLAPNRMAAEIYAHNNELAPVSVH